MLPTVVVVWVWNVSVASALTWLGLVTTCTRVKPCPLVCPTTKTTHELLAAYS